MEGEFCAMQIDGGTLLVCVHVEEKGKEDSQRVHTPRASSTDVGMCARACIRVLVSVSHRAAMSLKALSGQSPAPLQRAPV